MIERPGKSSSAIFAESMGDGPEGETEEAMEELVTIPPSQLGGNEVAPGDVVRLEVVEVDDETGSVTARYAHPKAEKEEETETKTDEPTIEKMAAAFD